MPRKQKGDEHFDCIVSVRTALDALDTRSHRSVDDNCRRARGIDCLTHSCIERVEILALCLHDLDAMSREGRSYAVLFEVLGRVASVGQKRSMNSSWEWQPLTQ